MEVHLLYISYYCFNIKDNQQLNCVVLLEIKPHVTAKTLKNNLNLPHLKNMHIILVTL